MNILVTGGSGFIGSHIVDKLIQYNHTVKVLDLKKPHRKDLDFVEGSIMDKNTIRLAMKDIEVVYHLAAVSNIDLVKENPLQTVEYNVMGTAYLLDEAREQDIKRFIFASSAMVHELKGHLYTFSKHASEQLCNNYEILYNLPFTIFRFGTVYGPRNRGADVISIFIENALNKHDLHINGTGEKKRNFIYVEDLAEGAIAGLTEEAKNQILTIAGLVSTSIMDLAMLIREVFDDKINIQVDNQMDREDDYEGIISGIDETITLLNWKPKINLFDGLLKTIHWYKNDAAYK